MNNYLRKSLKILLWVVVGLIILVVTLALSLNIPAVQNFVKDRAISYLKKKTKTEVSLNSINIAFPKDVVLNKFYMEDLKGDTLLYAEHLAVDISLFKLLKNQVEVNNIELKNIRANVVRIAPDTTFNFNFLVKAFMSEEKKTQQEIDADTSSALKFSVDKFLFENINIRYTDDVAGNDMRLQLGEFTANVDNFDLDNQKFLIDEIALKQSRLSYLQQKPLAVLAKQLEKSVDTAEVESATLPFVKINKLAFEGVYVNFKDQISNTQAIADLEKLNFNNAALDLTNMDYALDQLLLHNSKIKFSFKPEPLKQSTQTNEQIADAPSSIRFALKNIDLKGNEVDFNNLAEKPSASGMDFNHLKITDLSLSGKDIAYNKDSIAANISSASMKEKSGFVLQNLAGNANYNNREVSLRNFKFQTPNTNISSNALVQYSSIEELTKYPANTKIDLSIANSELGIRDLAFFSDAIPSNYRNLKLKVNTRVNGNLAKLNIPKLQLSGLRNTVVDLVGTASNVMDVDRLLLDLRINRFVTSRQDLTFLIPKGSLPNSVQIPNSITMSGFFKGGLNNAHTELALRTSMGNARIQGRLSEKDRYQANINLDDFNLGSLLKQEQQIGKITLTAKAEGKGFDMASADAKIEATINKAVYNKYTYQNIDLEANISNQKFNVKGVSLDENVDFTLEADGSLAGKYPQANVNLHIKQLDLQKLNFSTTEFKFAGKIDANIETADVDYLNGYVNTSSLQIVKEGKRIDVDTIQLRARSTEEANSLVLNSEVLSANFSGKYQLTNIAQAFINQLNTYYKFGEVKSIPEQEIRFDVQLYNSKLLKEFVPDLTTFSASSINGFLNTATDSLNIRAWFPKVVYANNNIDSTLLVIAPKGDELNYSLTVNSIETPSVNLFESEIFGAAHNNELDVNILLRDRARKERYALSGLFTVQNSDFRFAMKPENLLLNYDKWTVNPDNYIEYGPNGILANNFTLSQGNQLLRLESAGSTAGVPLNVTLKDFNIETLTSFADTDSALVGGIINGTAEIRDIQTNLGFDANLVVDKLRFQKDELGTLRLDANNTSTDAIEINAALTGIHEVRVNGFYFTKEEGSLDLNLTLEKLDLEFVESITGGQIRDGSGVISAKLSAKGPLTAPKILGDVNFKDAGFNIKYVNSYFRIPQETINFTDQGIRFNSFTLIDSLNKSARIDGMIYTKNYQDFSFDLDLRTDNFRALNSTEKDNELIYGTVYLSTNLQISGDMNQPVVNGTVNVNEDTKFFFALPADDPSVIEQSGIVQFIDADAPPFNGERALNVDSLTRSSLTGMNLSVNISIDKEAELSVVIDPSNGDALKVKGDGNLNATMDASGKISLTGRYQLTDGSYNLSVGGLARKEFKIQPDSYIVWTGEPTSANIDITALYEVNTAAIDLVADQVETLDASVRNTYKQKLDFQVLLYLDGELMKPDISFKIDLPEDERATAVGAAAFAKLQQVNSNESELNKQVFALLALNRFISENPFQSLAGGSSTSSIARQSVSKLLTEQLNSLADNLIQGIDLNLGVNSIEDYSSGNLENRTDLEVGLSKKLLNDRLTISVGSTFGIEGSRPTNQKSSNIAGNINVEYLLSADGRYRLRFYRRNETEGIVEGQIIETGVGFALVVEYNKFNEIFRKAARRRNATERTNNRTENAVEQRL